MLCRVPCCRCCKKTASVFSCFSSLRRECDNIIGSQILTRNHVQSKNGCFVRILQLALRTLPRFGYISLGCTWSSSPLIFRKGTGISISNQVYHCFLSLFAIGSFCILPEWSRTSTSSTWRTFSFCIGGIISPDILKRSGCQTLMSSRWKKEANSTILTREFMWTRPTLWLRRIHWHLVWWKCSWTCWCTVTCWWVSHLRRCTLDPWWLSLSFTLRSAPWQFISWVRNWLTSAGLESVAVEISGLNCGTSAGHNFFQTVLKCPQTYSISFIIVIFIFCILHYITLLYISFII